MTQWKHLPKVFRGETTESQSYAGDGSSPESQEEAGCPCRPLPLAPRRGRHGPNAHRPAGGTSHANLGTDSVLQADPGPWKRTFGAQMKEGSSKVVSRTARLALVPQTTTWHRGRRLQRAFIPTTGLQLGRRARGMAPSCALGVTWGSGGMESQFLWRIPVAQLDLNSDPQQEHLQMAWLRPPHSVVAGFWEAGIQA